MVTGVTSQMPNNRGDAQQHVVMIVANDVSTDTRVRKMAHDLATAGPQVTVLGISSTGAREEMWLGPARVVRLAVSDLLRTSRGRWFGSPNRFQRSRTMEVERQRYFNHQREVAARIGWLRADYFKGRSERIDAANTRELSRLSKKNERKGRIESKIEATAVGRSHLLSRTTLVGRKLLLRSDEVVSRGLRWRRRRWQARRELGRERRFLRAERRIKRQLKRTYRRFTRRYERHGARLIGTITAGGRADWRDALPELHDYEAVFGPELDQLRPDVIHAQDVHLLGVAARATSRAAAAGAKTKLVYDSHEYIQGLATHPRTLLAWSSLEREYLHRAERIITVAPGIAEQLALDYSLETTPDVVMNIPVVGEGGSESVRRAAGVDDSDVLLVYSGGLDETRGVGTLVKAVGRLDDVHLVLVSNASTGYTLDLERTALEGGYADRLHIVPFVQPQHVVTYLSSATIGVHTIVSGPINHELTLPNKVFEYMHARLPIVISNCKAMAEFVTAHEIGEVFISEDVDSLAKTITMVLNNLDKYHAAYERQPEMLERYSWRTERRKLFAVYRDLLGSDALLEDIETVELAPLTPVVG